ncbi:MAG: pyruvate dehydrogenase (acetyl-transferring) E1 component subunit alpha [Proteobacteria bacterium]|nr:pyruvate dehydrogenase (acetyl-transferring) E1 component subunit alpha [Pseudomonadota bacterium]
MSQKTKIIAHFDIPYFRYLNPQGEIEQEVPAFAKETDTVVSLYRMMMLTRFFDKKAVALQRTGKLGTYPSTLGQEAVSVGLGAAMEKEDVLCPYYREYGAQFWRGVRMEEILLYWGGDERGSQFTNNREDFPICVPIASQTLHAAGVATAIKLRQQKRAVVTAIGDGGTSRGDFYEAMNVAGAWELPVVFIINNNQWAISVPRQEQTKAQTLAQKAIAAGLEGWQIDGNDIFAVKEAVTQALTKARSGQGATVIEAITYRMGDHTTADDASRYRSAQELQENQQKDPIQRLRQYMINAKMWDEDKEKSLTETLTNEINLAVERFNEIPMPLPESMFDHLYETLPQIYLAQREAVKNGNAK